MAKLNGGTFKYTRRIKPGDPNEYNAPFREATAELSWSSAEEDAPEAAIEVMNIARQTTIDHVNLMLARPQPAPMVAPETTITSSREQVPVVFETKKELAPVSRKQLAEASQRAKAAEAPIVLPSSGPPVEVDIKLPPEPEAEDDILGDELNAPPETVISTEDLLAAITRKNAERLARPEGTKLNGKDGRAPLVIRELIGSYVESPKTSRDIPQSLRGKFLAELKEL